MDVTDGDTFDVRPSIGGTVTIRLHGVDAPESAQSYGTAATRAARQYVGGKSVGVSVEEIGHHGRAVARVEAEGGDLGAMLIGDGLAWHYRQYAPHETGTVQTSTRNRKHSGSLSPVNLGTRTASMGTGTAKHANLFQGTYSHKALRCQGFFIF